MINLCVESFSASNSRLICTPLKIVIDDLGHTCCFRDWLNSMMQQPNMQHIVILLLFYTCSVTQTVRFILL